MGWRDALHGLGQTLAAFGGGAAELQQRKTLEGFRKRELNLSERDVEVREGMLQIEEDRQELEEKATNKRLELDGARVGIERQVMEITRDQGIAEIAQRDRLAENEIDQRRWEQLQENLRVYNRGQLEMAMLLKEFSHDESVARLGAELQSQALRAESILTQIRDAELAGYQVSGAVAADMMKWITAKFPLDKDKQVEFVAQQEKLADLLHELVKKETAKYIQQAPKLEEPGLSPLPPPFNPPHGEPDLGSPEAIDAAVRAGIYTQAEGKRMKQELQREAEGVGPSQFNTMPSRPAGSPPK